MAYEEHAYSTPQTEGNINPWAMGFTLFAASMMVISGTFQVFQGLAAILDDDFFVIGRSYAFDLDVSTWGWIHLFVGAIVALAGLLLFTGAVWARMVAIGLAMLSMLVNFFYIPYYPVWSILIIAIDVAVIWGLARNASDLSELQE